MTERFGGELGYSHMGDIGRILAGERIRQSGLREEDLPRAEVLAEQFAAGEMDPQSLSPEDLSILQLFHPEIFFELTERDNYAA